LDNPEYGGVFQYIQQFQGYIWPGVVAAFIMPFILPRVPGSAGVAALLTGPVAYGILQFTAISETRPWGHGVHFLLQVLIAFGIVALVMTVITWIRPLDKPKELPVGADIELKTEPVVKIAATAVILGVISFFIIFW
jgi:SSS family solute:Na+ symporter